MKFLYIWSVEALLGRYMGEVIAQLVVRRCLLRTEIGQVSA